ncbi:HNH endonuclease [Vibrio mediterranei]|uniref:HNH endonuclease n=1 Tax=Vibrio mediterranei TaxID=689 RepID=UPI00228439CE|nr:HNH endonuclease [Vibrio mediterranei]MCY9853077.1 HNH endonuclease [Vibrio mediterranei]
MFEDNSLRNNGMDSMTSITPPLRSTSEDDQTEERRLLWCKEHGYIPLTEWQQRNEITDSDLYAVGLIDYRDSGIVSMSSRVVITSKGSSVLVQHGEDEVFSFWQCGIEAVCVCNDNLLKELTAVQKDKTPRQLELEDRAHHLKKFGYDKPLPDEELEFHERSYIEGPYCDIEVVLKKRGASDIFFCDFCGKTLSVDTPSFFIARRKLCFRCAKLAFNHLRPAARALSDESKKKSQESEAQNLQWRRNFASHLRRKPLFVRIAELFGRDEALYADKFLNEHPEPVRLKATTFYVALCPVHSPYSGHKTNRSWVLRRDERKCQACNFPTERLEVHHVIPRAIGGGNFRSNLITLCVECHNGERWFGHRRAFCAIDDFYQDIEWEWDITPTFLMQNYERLQQDTSLFLPKYLIDSEGAWKSVKDNIEDNWS